MADRKIKCLIVEDEPIAAEVLEDYIADVGFLELKGVCKDAIYALEFLESQEIDLIFLDIHLPKIKGLDFLKTLNKRPQVILTTAYHQYALDAFDEGVVDYLLKPIEFSRFLKAVNKLDRRSSVNQEGNETKNNQTGEYHFFTVDKKKRKVFFDDVLYIESLKDYSRIHTTDDSIVIRSQIGSLENIFDPQRFIRVHRSFIVARDKVDAYSSSTVEIAGISIPIGRTYRPKLSEIWE